MEARVVPQQERHWAGGVQIQQDARQNFTAQTVPTGLIATSVAPNMYLASVPQQPGIIMAPALAPARQQEARFDAYKNMNTGMQRRY